MILRGVERRYQAAAFFHWFEDEFVKAIMNFIVADSKATFKKPTGFNI